MALGAQVDAFRMPAVALKAVEAHEVVVVRIGRHALRALGDFVEAAVALEALRLVHLGASLRSLHAVAGDAGNTAIGMTVGKMSARGRREGKGEAQSEPGESNKE